MAYQKNSADSVTEEMGSIDRLPPHSMEAEMGVLSCCLQAPNEALGLCVEKLKGGGKRAFYDLRHQLIFEVLIEMFNALVPVDMISVEQKLKDLKVLEQIGGGEYLRQLQDAAPSPANLAYYLEILREKYLLRQIITTCTGVIGKIYDFEGNVDELLAVVEAEMSGLSEFTMGEPAEQHIRDVIAGVVADMEQWHYSRGSLQLRGLPTGPPGNYLDKVLLGLRTDHYNVIAGRPGDGKSSFAMNIVEYLAGEYVWFRPTGKKVTTKEGNSVDETVPVTGIPIAVFSIEMDNESLGYRLLFGRAGVDEPVWNQGFKKDGDDERLVKASMALAKMNIYLDDTPAQTIGQIAAKARRMAKQYGIKLFVLDYLQLCVSDNPRDDERTRLDKISKKIMALKKQLKIPWLVLAQMNRNIETAERDRSPVLSDLAGSGSIEQDADKVIILKKPARKDLEKRYVLDDGGELPSDSEILSGIAKALDWSWAATPTRVDAWVVKNRRGPRGKAQMVFQNNLCRFEDWHMFKVKHGVEQRKEGESKHMGTNDLPTNDDLAK